MSTITVNRGELTAIPFSITDAANGLVGKRVTCSIARAVLGTPVITKESALPGSSSEITISTQLAGSITGFIHLLVSDFALLGADSYAMTLWTDDGVNGDRAVTPGGADTLTITKNVSRV